MLSSILHLLLFPITLYAVAFVENGLGGQPAPPNPSNLIIYVWCGSITKTTQDFLLTIPLTWNSATGLYNTQTPIQTNSGFFATEPHHLGVNLVANKLIAGGLFSFMRPNTPDAIFFDITTRTAPKVTSSSTCGASAVTDDCIGLTNGGFLTTMMGSRNGSAPGRLVYWDPTGKPKEFPDPNINDPSLNDFNPHGLAVSSKSNVMMTADFIEPRSILSVVPGGVNFRNSIRVWNYDLTALNFWITKKINIVPNGVCGGMDVKFIPGHEPLAYVTCAVTSEIYLIDPTAGTATRVFNFAGSGAIGLHILTFNSAGTRAFASLHQNNAVLYLDTSNPSAPVPLSICYGPPLQTTTGPHMLTLTPDEQFVVVTNYFLNAGAGSKVTDIYDNKVWIAKVEPMNLQFLQVVNVDVGGSFGGQPHGVVVINN